MCDGSNGMTLYRERAYLLGGYVAMFGGVFSYDDPATPGWPVLYIETPEGQISDHIHPNDVEVFGDLNIPTVEGYPWDGHTAEEKYRRIARLNLRIPKMTYARPEYGSP